MKFLILNQIDHCCFLSPKFWSLFFYYYFSHPIHFSCALFFFPECHWDFRILKSELSFSFVMGWKNEFFTNSDFIIRKLQIKTGHVTWIFRIIESEHPLNTPFQGEKLLGLYNLNYISTNFEHVCNMDSHFKDNINLPNSHG